MSKPKSQEMMELVDDLDNSIQDRQFGTDYRSGKDYDVVKAKLQAIADEHQELIERVDTQKFTIQRLQYFTDWISVKDRLPEDDGILLICSDDGLDIGFYSRLVTLWFTKDGDEHQASIEVTHWMPLPEQPNKKIQT